MVSSTCGVVSHYDYVWKKDSGNYHENKLYFTTFMKSLVPKISEQYDVVDWLGCFHICQLGLVGQTKPGKLDFQDTL